MHGVILAGRRAFDAKKEKTEIGFCPPVKTALYFSFRLCYNSAKGAFRVTYRFFTGGYADKNQPGICRFSFDPQRGFALEAAWTGFVNPSFALLHPTLPVLYTVEETTPQGAVHAWALTAEGPRHLGGLPSGGADPCHLLLDGEYLYAANYTSGSLAAFRLNADGSLRARADLRQHSGHGPNPDRQECAHVHFSMALGGEILACDLGQDTVFRYIRENGQLKELGRVPFPAGSGPRHLAASPALPDRLYCVAELGSQVYALTREGDIWRIDQAASMLPPDFAGENTAAAIHITPDARYLLASNRGHDSIAVFALSPEGALGRPVLSACVAQPRDFLIAGDHILVGSQRDSLIRAYRLDRDTGRLTDTGFTAEAPHPVCFQPWRSAVK